MRLEATNKNIRGGAKLAPPLPGRVKFGFTHQIFVLITIPLKLKCRAD